MRWLRSLSLRTRLLAGLITLALASFAIVAGIVYAEQSDFLTQRADEQALGAAPAVGRALDAEGVPHPGGREGPGFGPGPGGGPPSGGAPPGGGASGAGPAHGPDRDERFGGRRGGPPRPSAISLPPGVYGQRRDASGKALGSVVITYGQAAPSPPRLPAELEEGEVVTAASRDGSLEYRVAATRSGDRTTTVVAIPLSGVDEQLDRLALVLASVFLGVLLLLGLTGWYVIGFGLRPLDRMGATAGRIAAGDLSERVEPSDDTTEVGRLGRALNAMLHQIEGAFRERAQSEDRLRRFLADASHELRTPLSSIRGYAELYRMGAARDPAGAEKAMSRIEQEAARMGVLVEDLLTLARLDEVRESVREPVDLAELARDAAGDARATAPDRTLAFDARGEDTQVLGDPDQLRQVIGNLVRNALVHTPPGTPVEIRVGRDGGRVRLDVRDHGHGLPVDDGAELFERFWRADPGRGRGRAGAGLGLAIVQAIVSAHGGEVHAETVPDAGGGARFTVVLPVS